MQVILKPVFIYLLVQPQSISWNQNSKVDVVMKPKGYCKRYFILKSATLPRWVFPNFAALPYENFKICLTIHFKKKQKQTFTTKIHKLLEYFVFTLKRLWVWSIWLPFVSELQAKHKLLSNDKLKHSKHIHERKKKKLRISDLWFCFQKWRFRKLILF